MLLGGAAAVSLACSRCGAAAASRALALVLVGAWLLTGEIYATVTNSDEAQQRLRRDAAAAPQLGRPATARRAGHLPRAGARLDPNELWLTEFWNRSLDHVASLDGSAPGPGPTIAPRLVSPDGTLGDYTGDPYTLAGGGVALAGAGRRSARRLLALPHPAGLAAAQAEEGVYSDGWHVGATLLHLLRPRRPGTLRIDLSRTAYNGAGPPGAATIGSGRVRLDAGRRRRSGALSRSDTATRSRRKEVTVADPRRRDAR